MHSKSIFKIIKRIKLKDILAIIIFIFVFPIAFFYKLYLKVKNKKIWLICEEKDTAGDNRVSFI